MKATAKLPDDPALPGIAAIRAKGVAGVLPGLGLEGCPVELLLCGYTPGTRATLQARAGERRVAIKAYAYDPAPEAELYRALAAAGLGGDSEPRVPPLLAFDRDLQLLVIGWLEGPTAGELVKGGQGQRAGEMTARWLRRARSLAVKLGPPLGAARVLQRAIKCVSALAAADPALGIAAAALAGTLSQKQPNEGAPGLVHGAFYARHVLDLGDGPGVIDWECFGQGPVELDAGMFLATIWRLRLLRDPPAAEVSRAEEAFLAGTAGLLDGRALAWHRAAALLRLSQKRLPTHRRDRHWLVRAQTLLGEAARLADSDTFLPEGARTSQALPVIGSGGLSEEERPVAVLRG
jgi:aminoglycoside phosphotransferase (APT) family kinase protein